MDFNVIRLFHKFERAPRMSWLSTASFTTVMPQTFGVLFKPIAGRWLSAVVTIFGDLVIQLLNPFCKFAKGLSDLHHHSFFPLVVSRVDFIFTGQI